MLETVSAATPDLKFSPKGLLIGGDWQEAADGTSFETINPSNGDRLGEVPDAKEADVDRAVAAAEAASRVEAGRLAYESGRIPRRLYATASSPLEGVASF